MALQHLIGWLTDLIDATDVLTDAALRSDHEAFVKAGADVLALAANRAPDLTEVTEIYNGLRLAIVTRQAASAI